MIPIHVARLRPDMGVLEVGEVNPASDVDVLVAVGAPTNGRDDEVVVARVTECSERSRKELNLGILTAASCFRWYIRCPLCVASTCAIVLVDLCCARHIEISSSAALA